LEFNDTFSTHRLYRAFENYVAVIKVKLMRKLTMLRVLGRICRSYKRLLKLNARKFKKTFSGRNIDHNYKYSLHSAELENIKFI